MADDFKIIKITQPVPAGPLQEELVGAIDSSTGSADAGKVVVTGSDGKIDGSLVTGGGGGGSTVEINGVEVDTPNFNDTTPAAPLHVGRNVTWQKSGSSVSAYIDISGTFSFDDGTFLDPTTLFVLDDGTF